MRLTLDHLIVRAADPAATLAELAERAGAPVLAPAEEVGGLVSGIVRAGPVDVEVLGVGRPPPARPHGYGLGFTADVPLDEVVAALRVRGLATSGAVRGAAGEGTARRTWRAAQVHGLLPDPFPAPVRTAAPGRMDAVLGAVAGFVGGVAPLARAATRRAGSSMVVVTEYGFDAAAWRATAAGPGPRVLAVEVGTGGDHRGWDSLPLGGPVPIRLDHTGPPGVRRVLLAAPPAGRADFALGDVAFEFVAGEAAQARAAAGDDSAASAKHNGE